MNHVLETVGIIFCASMLTASAVVVKYRWFPPAPDAEPREDVAEYISMMVGVLYALIIGLALVSVWETRDNASGHVQAEAGALHQSYLLADGLPPAAEHRVRAAVQAYTVYVTDQEWPLMEHHRPLGADGWRLLHAVQEAWQSSEPASNIQQQVDQVAFAQVSSAYEARSGRGTDVRSGLSGVLWVGLIAGGVLTVGFMFLFGVERSTTHLVLVMGLTGLITFQILLIYALNSPFGGLLGISPTPYAAAVVGG